ncbi:hypothetical protein ALC53_12886 [Atta colombica]|uniref:Uncharacterized protein n=1 Tax=Atta colombica TaxID=520822 RepID=A0A151HYP4_9HYME|nr:hypothetical protein ALC53_12886 [Atta colombica]
MEGLILYFQYIYTIYMTQILMNHGCFEAYLFEIQRNASPIYAHCHTTADMAMHMLLFGPSWTAERTSFFKRLGLDVLDMRLHCQGGYILRCVLDGLTDFCEAIMTKKEERAEREPSGSSLKRQRALLARVCLGSDDNYM